MSSSFDNFQKNVFFIIFSSIKCIFSFISTRNIGAFIINLKKLLTILKRIHDCFF
jgi:hypothetical protein